MILKSKAVINATVDPLQRTTPIVAALPRWAAMGGGYKYPAILLS
ncbi:unnamed protein product, partial [marine sediment metagenome]